MFEEAQLVTILKNPQFWEMASYIVTALGLPYAIFAFLHQAHKEREMEAEELYQKLAEEYAKFAHLLILNADLQLMTGKLPDDVLDDEQRERKKIIFDVLIALFERAFLLVYEPRMNKKTRRLWATWEDYIRFWCKREDFRKALPELLVGEDPTFSAYMCEVAGVETRSRRR